MTMTEKSRGARLLWAGRFAAIFVPLVAAGVGGASIATAATESMVYSFAGGTTDGANPYSALTPHAGNFYGTTYAGGSNGYGTVFKVTPSGVETVVCNLPGGIGGVNGAGPTGTLAVDGSGNLYGTAAYNSISSGVGTGDGVVFECTLSGVYTVLGQFSGTANGAKPFAGLVYDGSSTLYGTTVAGGASGYGTVYKQPLSGTLSALVSFSGSTGSYPGNYPWAGVTLNGTTLYGTTVEGGSSSDGVAFSVTTSGGSFTNLNTFASGSNGYFPYGGLFLGASSVLFGTTWLGGNTAGDGVVFRLIPSGSSYLYNVAYTFAGGASDGANPYSTPIRDTSTGNVYGTTVNGGASGYGTVYKLTPSGTTYTETILHSFTGGTTDGANPYAALVFDSSGDLWGTTLNGGASGKGIVFEITLP